MANMFDRYGIKEVCDVTFYKLNTDGSQGAPVLYLDTLKVSTMEQTAENTSARGGKGNPELIMWDYNKEITVTLEDALFSAKSMAMMFGDNDGVDSATNKIQKTVLAGNIEGSKAKINGKEYALPTDSGDISYYKNDGTEGTSASFDFAVISFTPQKAEKIEISYNTFPGSYKVIGDTYARSEASGEDSFFQLVFNKAKVQSEVTLTMEAEGDPSTFSMNLKILRPAGGRPMVELIKYDLTPSA